MKKNKLKIFTTIVAIIFIFTLSFNISYAGESKQALSKYGSRSDEVRKIQTRLKDLGYFNDKIDGIFGAKTQAAVKSFQKAKGLTVDGIVGAKTLKALGLSESGKITNQNDINLLAKVVSAESRGEAYEGQVAVAAVILNRVEHPSFPSTIAGVVYQKGAFTCMTDGQINQPVADSCYRAARDAMNGLDPSGGAIYYYNPKTAKSAWIRNRPIIKTIGRHVFCV